MTRRLVVALLPVLAACNPTVRVATPEPLKVDVDMRVDIYQHATSDAPANGPDAEAQDRRRARMAEIETEQANLWRERAFPGEWIETQVDGTWRWEQKQGG